MKNRQPLWNVMLAALLLVSGVAHAGKQTFITNRSLSFGRFVAGSGGTVTVSPDGVRSSAGVVLLGSAANSAAFTFTDTASSAKNVIITLPSDGGVILTSGTKQMTLKQFTRNPSGSIIMQSGSLAFSVGATLSVAANQSPGNYSGSVPITLEYQ